MAAGNGGNRVDANSPLPWFDRIGTRCSVSQGSGAGYRKKLSAREGHTNYLMRAIQNCRFHLKLIFHRKLQNTRICRARNLSEVGVLAGGHGDIKVNMIGEIKNLEARFQTLRFMYLEIAAESKIDIEILRASERERARVAKGSNWICRECAGIQPQQSAAVS